MIKEILSFIPLALMVFVVGFVSYIFWGDDIDGERSSPTVIAVSTATMPPAPTPSPTATLVPPDEAATKIAAAVQATTAADRATKRAATTLEAAIAETQATEMARITAEAATAEAKATETAQKIATPTTTPTPAPVITILQTMNIRAGPGTNYPIVGSGAPGDTAKILGRNDDGSWFQIEYPTAPEGLAWVYGPLVQTSGSIEAVDITLAPPPPVSPTPTLSPAEAVVIASNGAALRDGPGDQYNLIAMLQSGTVLDIKRRLFNNDDWIKVTVNSDSEIKEGWITTAPEATTINLESLDDIPPMYEYGPKPVQPERFETVSVEGFITFKWEPAPFPLAEHQYYSLILFRDDRLEAGACFHDQFKETEFTLVPQEYGCAPGVYQWGVGVATDLAEGKGPAPDWQDDSERDERIPIGIGVPHPDRPEGGGGSRGPTPCPGCRP